MSIKVNEPEIVSWKKVHGAGNEILKASWGRILYNPDTEAGHRLAGSITELLNAFGRDLVDGEETALYDHETNTWRILTGDWRQEYEEVFPDLDKCIAFYESKKDKYRNNYSTD